MTTFYPPADIIGGTKTLGKAPCADSSNGFTWGWAGQSYCYLPQGWDAVWQAAKAASNTTPAWVMAIGDSITCGSNGTDPFVNNWVQLLQNSLVISPYSTYADYYPAYGYSTGGTMPWTAPALAGALSAQVKAGWHGTYTNSGSGGAFASYYQVFTVPYNVTSLDLVTLDGLSGGTWKFNISGSGSFAWTMNGAAQSAGTLGSDTTITVPAATINQMAMRKISVSTALPAGTTVSIGKDNGGVVVFPMGISCFKAATGIGFSRFAIGGYQAAYYNVAGNLTDRPFGHTLMLAGGVPNVGGPAPPPTSPYRNQNYGITVASGGAGSVDAGSRVFAYSWVGAGGSLGISGESSLLAHSGTYTQAGATTVSLSNINDPPGQSGEGTLGICNAQINIYVTKAANFGSGSAGSVGNPYFLSGTITGTGTGGGVNSYTHNVADSTLSVQYAGGTAAPAWGTWGFPLSPHLVIIELGINDIIIGNTVAQMAAGLFPVITALRKGRANCSILFVGVSYPDALLSDQWQNLPNSPSTGVWYQYLDQMHQLARMFGCGFVNFNNKWGENPNANGMISGNGVHPTNAGYQDIANTLLALL